MRSLHFVCIWFWLSLVCSEDTPSVSNFIRRSGQAGEYLYIQGGQIQELNDGYNDSTSPTLLQVNDTLSLSLAEEWTNITASFISTPGPAPAFRGEDLWVDQQSFYMWGGQAPNGNLTTLRALWMFTVDGRGSGDWSTPSPNNDAIFTGIRRGNGASWTTCGGYGLALGGFGWAWTDFAFSDWNTQDGFLPLPGLLSYEISSRTWANESANGFNGLGTSHFGEAACLPSSGTNGTGIFLPLGGQTSGLTTFSRYGDPLNNFNNLSFFDIATQTWHWQTTTGVIPPGRVDSCVVGVQGQNDTYEIFMYGGLDPLTSKSFGDVYALSIPGFVWTKFNISQEFSRWEHSCTIGGKSQMIIVGGFDNSTDHPTPDPWSQGLGVFDLIALDWGSSYQLNASDYKTPSAISDWYNTG
ncbi:hypothetical protein F4678DRAFT_483876 [Xylaria arbuscula]|nr:hypothetical protein F4678DRAFT_483876 [Xylaria arbuscula]